MVKTMNDRPPPSSPSSATSAIIIDGDPVAQNALASFLRAIQWDVRVAPDGPRGLALLDERPSSVVFADWSLPGISGLDICERIRQRLWSERPYLIVTTGKDSQELWRALAAGADDVLRKPFERREVETRIALARFVTEGSARRSLAEAVVEAITVPAGELVVRQGEVLARLMFSAGRICWVTVSPATERFADHLAAELGLGEEELREVFEESKVSGVPFDRLLVAWNLAERDALRECQRGWLVRKLDRVREMASPSVLFVPLPPGGPTFEGFLVEDIAPWLKRRAEPPRSSAPPSVDSGSVSHRVSAAMQIEGALAAFALMVRDGTCLAQKGDRSHVEVSWALARALHSMPPGAARGADILLSAATCHYVARGLDGDTDVLLVVVIDNHVTTSGKARLQLARVAASTRSRE